MATGRAEALVEPKVHIWDVAAVQAIVEEAGGRMTNWDNQVTIDRPDTLASNGKLHAEVLQFLTQ